MQQRFSFIPLFIISLIAFVSILTACKKDNNSRRRGDSLYVLSSIYANGKLQDSLVYDATKGQLQSILSNTDTAGLYFHMVLNYTNNKVSGVSYYGTRNDFMKSDSVVYNEAGFIVYTRTSYSFTKVNFELNANGQPVFIGDKDTVFTSNGKSIDLIDLTYTGSNTATTDIVYFNIPYPLDTMGSTYNISASYDDHPNPFYALYRLYPALREHFIPELTFALDAANNPVSATRHETSRRLDYVHTYEMTDNNTISYVYDSITRFPLEQRYTEKEISYNNAAYPVVVKFNYRYLIISQ